MLWADRVNHKADVSSSVANSVGNGADAAPVDNGHEAAKHAPTGGAFKKVAAVALVATATIAGHAYAKSKSPVDISGKALNAAEYLARGFHAIPKPDANPIKEMPSMHRLMNVVGMVGGFASTQYLSNIMFGCKINGSKCEEIPKEKVPKPLQFLHGIIEYNPFSDAPRDQWLKVVHQMLPAVGGALGAVKGSDIFFNDFNKRGRDYKKWMKQPTLNPIEAHSAAQYAQGEAASVLAGATAIWSGASGLGPLYGFCLNESFRRRNGAQVAFSKSLRCLTGNASKLGFGPEKGLAETLKGMEMVMRDGDAEGFAKQLVENGIAPLVKLTPEREQEIVKRLRDTFDGNARQVTNKDEIPKLAEYMRKQVMQVIAETDKRELDIGDGKRDKIAGVLNRFPGLKNIINDIRERTEQPPLVPPPPSRGRG